jgi:ribonucleoside-diphosphate reductase alpha chain
MNTQVDALKPGQIRVIKRDGCVSLYEAERIRVAITKAYMDPRVVGHKGAVSAEVKDKASKITESITNTFKARMPSGGTIHIEEVQDQVELALMRAGEHQVARYYVIYREEHSQQRASKQVIETPKGNTIHITNKDGVREPLDYVRLETIVTEACKGLDNVTSQSILDGAMKNLFDGVGEKEVSSALIMTARSMVERDPEYSFVTARLLLDSLRTETLCALGVANGATQSDMETLYSTALKSFIAMGVKLELLDERLQNYDMDMLANALDASRDNQFTYLGLQTLYDRYFIHSDGNRLELPQCFFMRVAMGLAINEDDPNARAIDFYNLLSSFDYMSSTPTLFNAGTRHSQLSSCYLTTIPDDMFDITKAWSNNAMLSKWAGGLGNDWTPVRAMGSHIKGTNGQSQGVVPFLKVANDIAVAVNQGGKRKGAVCAYLESWHMDIEEFLELRKNTGDDRRRTHDMNTANWIPDLFMKRVMNNGQWTLFSPNEVPELHDLMGAEFEAKYLAYEEKADRGEMKTFKRIEAGNLWRKMLGMLFETGHPWLTFKDPCNLRSPQQHVGVVHSSNLCTEITLNTSAEEIAVCNLGSINLAQHTTPNGIDREKLNRTVKTAVRMLDNVIDINYYAVPEAKNANMKHRPVGLGLMGFQDALYIQGIPYSSDDAVTFADQSMEAISYASIEASAELAQERGTYQTFDGSLWSKGILPIDSIDILAKSRGEQFLKMDRSTTLDWDTLREKVKAGMRNSNVMAIAPTATISNIVGVCQSIEPTYQNLYVKSNLSGEFTVVNPHLVRALKEEGLWDPVMVNDLKYYDGSLQSIERVPEHIKQLFATAFEVGPQWLVEAASRRQKWLDQAQSLNLYIKGASGKKLDVTYKMAWLCGLKTTYYLRALGATSTEKSTVTSSTLNSVAPSAPVPKACSIDDNDCEACQ